MDAVVQQSLCYGAAASFLLSPAIPARLSPYQAKWFKHMKRPILAAMLMYLFWLPILTPRSNFYSLLEVDIHATKNDILQGYRSVSKKYHPDKISAEDFQGPNRETAEEIFLKLKTAQEVLTTDSRKHFYQQFGDLQELGSISEKIGVVAVCLSLVAHLFCFCIGYIVSYLKYLNFARQIFVVYNIGIFCLDLQQRFVEEDDSLNFLPYVASLLPFEKIHFFRSEFPFVLVGSLCIAAWQFTDVPAKNLMLLRSILSTNRALTERAHELIRVTAHVKSLATPSTSAIKAQIASQAPVQAAAVKARGIVPNATDTANGAPGSTAMKGPWFEFANSLNEEQLEHFKKVIQDQYRLIEQEEHAPRRGFDFNWSQMSIWAVMAVVWLYCK